ncbi:G1/S-specific cyclin Pcl5, putative [Talaromyces stipitatus ATCC 10500]|uniref:G1/S-specific cyclin Pcl5, putative n=1 Tax=Talaromyces stipitatus (strain ATCC 10500 / CBS 375.48 / QM 6759 / NRRL 1006) TaxID=441959 RepID=B8MKI3_TALSN|nr:G1/S-specific cyclin Pcl5, putative [Talaromyces stipitatus ATCC 10500]EED15338.1 G1/S-specific cyclin Pcl5, putative [Talaromyces stipitatus ATCC 10500]
MLSNMSGSDVLAASLSDPSHQRKTVTSYPYSSSVGSSASSSSSSVFSLDCVSTQSSISSSSTTAVDVIWENDESGESSGRGLPHSENASHCLRNSLRGLPSKVTECPVPPELRKNPRRTACPTATANGASASCPRLPPSLVRQCDRKVNFVDSLVVAVRSESPLGCKGVLPLRTFIQETLRRSRTSFSTLQVALYYLIKIRPHVPNHDFTMEQPRDSPCARAMQCGRRMFLAALILASKYLQDRNYSARAWSKISGLHTQEINQNEMMFLQAVDWKLHVPESIYHRWTDIVLKYTPGPASSPNPDDCWKTLIPRLTPDLVTVDVEPSSPPEMFGLDFSDAPSPRRSPFRVNNIVSMCSPSEQQSPTCPRSIPVLEPSTRVESSNPTLPALHKLGLLPTPQLTPQSCAASTPAVSVRGTCSRRPSFASAMSQAQNMCMSRLALESRPFPTSKPVNFEVMPPLTRRSSLARSTSSASSPDSMVSDVSTISSRSSRSSSISSCASATCAPSQPRLAVTATRRCAAMTLKECRKNLAIHSPIDESSLIGVYSSPESGLCGTVPDLSNFSLNTPVDMTAHEAAQGLCELSGAMLRSQSPVSKVNESRPCRKRGRTSSDDQILQSNVRELISPIYGNEVLTDEKLAKSFLLPKDPSDHCLSSIQLPIPIPAPKGGIKRACCSAEVRRHNILPTTPTPMR